MEFALNNTVAASTGITPTELAFGQQLRTPLDHVLSAAAPRNPAAHNVAQHIQHLTSAARSAMARAQEAQKRYADTHRRPEEFAVGDSVLLSSLHLNFPGSRKFKQRFVGPFTVQRRVGT